MIMCATCYESRNGQDIDKVLCSRLGLRAGMEPCRCRCGHGGNPIWTRAKEPGR